MIQHENDGVYQVTTSYLCAGFIIQENRLAACAPILRKKFNYWWTIAVKLKGEENGS